jgi:phage repressor protein C with HTH and peptisase S24 domain
MRTSGTPSTGSRPRAGLSASGLAKRAGLDPTTFNKSKRVTPEGRPRWPSTESIAKSLQATGVTLDSFVALISDRAAAQAVPLIALAQASAGGYFDDSGLPSGKGWDEIAFPAVNDEHVYALEVTGDSMLPVYRDGTVIVVSPSAPIRRGDRVVLGMQDGEVMARVVEAPHRKVDRVARARPGSGGAHARRRRGALDRPHHVGESVMY